MKRIKTAAVLLLALAMLCGLGVTAFAADNASLDFSQTGSIGLTLEDGDGNAVTGGAVTLYQVATLYLNDGDMAYAYTDAFADCGIELDVENTSLAAALAACVTASTPGTEQAIGADGTVSFTDLELGLYLVVQTTDSDNYETINPFVVTVPIDSDGEWVYTVDASPKVGTVTPIEPTPTPTATPTETPAGTETTEETETPAGSETPAATDPPAGTETETPEETASPSPVPTATATPAASDGSSDDTLPQTGQLNWPVWVLAGFGIALFVLGFILTRERKQRGDHAE